MRRLALSATLLLLSALSSAPADSAAATVAAAPAPAPEMLESPCTPPAEPCKGHPKRCCGGRPPSCAPQPCPGHKGRTFCPNVHTPGQCDKAPVPCPPGPCPPPPPPQPPVPPGNLPNCAFIRESDTGPGVSDYAKGVGHYACVPVEPSDPPRLLLFMIALSSNDYTKIIETAAEVGMHAIGLMYQNKPGTYGGWGHGRVCGDASTGYPNHQNASEALCVHHVELMKTFGQGDPRVPPNRANYGITRENSILGRTESLLRFLSNASACTAAPQPCPGHPTRTWCRTDPAKGQCDAARTGPCPPCPPTEAEILLGAGTAAGAAPPGNLGPPSSWASFLNASGAPEWTKITAGGHSRASTFPPLLGKFFPIERAVMWGGVGDYQPTAGKPASWLSEPSLVDGLDMYACDPALACNAFRPNYDALKMPVG